MVALTLRLFAHTSADEAEDLAERLRAALKPVAAETGISAVRPYWKIPEYQEVRLDVTVHAEARRALSLVTSRLAAGWIRQGDTEAIWNPGGEGKFLEPAVRWAHVEVIEQGDRPIERGG